MTKIRYDTIYQYTWCLCVITLPWAIKLNSIAIILLGCIWIAGGDWQAKAERLKASPWTIPFFLFFFIHIVGLLYTENLRAGLLEVEKKATFLILPLLAASGKTLDRPFFSLAKKSFVFSCAILVLASLSYTTYHYYHSTHEANNFGRRTEELFHMLNPNAAAGWEYFSYIQIGSWMDLHPGYFSLHIIFCLMILLHRVSQKGEFQWRIAAGVFLFLAFLVLLASRMAILSFGFTLVCAVGWGLWKKRSPRLAHVSWVALVTLSILVLINPVTRFRLIQEPRLTGLEINENVTDWNSVNLRILEWEASWNTIRSTWLTGVGTGDAQDALREYYAFFNAESYMDYNSHNQYFQTIIEVGLVGLTLLVCCLFLPVFQSHITVLHISFILIFGLMCLTKCLLARQKGIVFFTLFQSLFLSIRSAPSR